MDKPVKKGLVTLPSWNQVVEYGSKPNYVFVGGFSHTPEFFEELGSELLVSGYISTTVTYPTCNYLPEYLPKYLEYPPTQWDEVTAIQHEVLRHLDGKEKDVVLVLHCYGGWPGSRAVKGLDKETRLKEGKCTGIIEIVFVAAILVPDDVPMADYSHLPSWLDVIVHIPTLLSFLGVIISPRTATVDRTGTRFLFCSATWKDLSRTAGSQLAPQQFYRQDHSRRSLASQTS